jgi:hypothetical protein
MKSTTNAIIWVLIIIVSVVAAFSVFADWASQTTTVSLLGSTTSSTESVSGLDIAGNDTFLSPDSDDEDPDWRIYVPYIDIALAALIIIAGAVCLAKGAKGAGWGAFSLILSIAGAGVTAAFALWDTFDSTTVLDAITYETSPELGAWLALGSFAFIFILSLGSLYAGAKSK